jgi:hypothetical protein
MAKKKRTRREQDRIDLARWRLAEVREQQTMYRRAIKAEEMRFKRLVSQTLATGRVIVNYEKSLEQADKRVNRLQEKLKCLTATK